MQITLLVASAIAILATLLAITRLDAVHALLYLVVSLLAVAVVLYTLGAPFAAALEVIIYAGAIVVLFVFVVMMLNLGRSAVELERRWVAPGMWIGPALLSLVLLGEMAAILGWVRPGTGNVEQIGPRQVGALLFGPYLLAVELASMLLLAGLVGAVHLGRRGPREEQS